MSKVKIAPSNCWEWQGATSGSGYGHLHWSADEPNMPAHRGHLMDESNTRVITDARGRTQRLCRSCLKVSQRRYDAKRRGKS